jgi:hypothetical protein
VVGEVVAQTEYLDFVDASTPGAKTRRIWVMSRSSGVRLGSIRWKGTWRQYVLFPEPDTVWNRGCLEDVNERIGALMAERRER